MMQRDKAQWIDEAMNSLDNLPPARPAHDLYGRIAQAIKTGIKKDRVIPLTTVSAAAAVLLLLFAANYFSLFGQKPAAKTDTMEEITKYYQLTDEGYGI